MCVEMCEDKASAMCAESAVTRCLFSVDRLVSWHSLRVYIAVVFTIISLLGEHRFARRWVRGRRKTIGVKGLVGRGAGDFHAHVDGIS